MNIQKFKTILIIFISVVIIFSCAYSKSIKEGLTNNNTIVLMGDSVLNNANYVPEGKSVYDILHKKLNNVINVSKDGATIVDLYSQLDKLPINLNNSQTYIFISSGGNDILKFGTNITELFNKYIKFLQALRVKLGSAKINIMNLYLPSNPEYQMYKSSVEKWNKLINENSNNIGEMYNVIDLYGLLKSPEDFVYNIEPSVVGSEKIANIIYVTQ